MADKVPLLAASYHNSASYDADYESYEAPDVRNGNKSINTGIAAIFSVFFDNKTGNIVEWSKSPLNLKLDGVEFKAMPSGLHKTETDYVIFRQRNLYGLACFSNKKTGIVEERGVRLRSVGVLCRDYRGLTTHFSFLESAVKNLNDTPGNYCALETYLEKNQDVGGSQETLSTTVSSLFKPLSDIHVDEVSASVGSLTALLYYFGNSIMLLWKSLLLRKRILIYSDVPIGIICARVHAIGHLLNGTLETLKFLEQPKRLYYVNLNDISAIEKTKFYIACTSEKIFEQKKHLYDIYVEANEIRIVNPEDRKFLIVTPLDLKHTISLKDDAMYYEEKHAQEKALKRFFGELNDKVIQFVKKYSSSGLTQDELDKSKLFDKADSFFVQDLSDFLDANIMVELPASGCC